MRRPERRGLSVLQVDGEGSSMIDRSFPSDAFVLLPSPFKGEAGRGMGLPLTPPSEETSVRGGVGA